MRNFCGTYTNKIDKKGRTSVPSVFRSILEGADGEEIKGAVHVCVWPGKGCLMATTTQLYDAHLNRGKQLDDIFADNLDEEARVLAERTHCLLIDENGRIVLSEQFRQHAGIELEDNVTFAGQGNRFVIWSHKSYAAREKNRQGGQDAV